MDEKKYSQLYQALLQEVLQFHSGNQRRIRKGMLSLLLVPLVFLVLLFLSEGSRVIFLLLWIMSMFGIAAYLIAVEYIDYEMQNKVKKITKKEVELDQLTPLPSAMPQLLPMLLEWAEEEHTNISLPSLRVDGFSEELANRLNVLRRSGLTFAPEAGTQRLRDVINKNVTEEELLKTCSTAFSGGWTGATWRCRSRRRRASGWRRGSSATSGPTPWWASAAMPRNGDS